MRLGVTGFVSLEAGSVASGNALILRKLLEDGHEIDFFSKPSFVDPGPLIEASAHGRFVSVVNRWSDGFRRALGQAPILGELAGINDAGWYNRVIARKMSLEHRQRPYDIVLWMGDYARGSGHGACTVSFVQGPPGTDARSIRRRFDEIRKCGGLISSIRWRLLAGLRLSVLGLPPFRHTDHFILGSSWSKRTLNQAFGVSNERISTLPYPIDLELFKPMRQKSEVENDQGSLRVLWVGRIVPRKRIDLFLDGAANAIRAGIDLRLTVVGSIGFILGYEKLINAFPFPDRLTWLRHVPRESVRRIMNNHDVLVQPSDEENFGSSVAEAQACGLPVIVGKTNGNADYLCPRDIHLTDDHPKTLAEALARMAERKKEGRLGSANQSRRFAEETFCAEQVTKKFVEILKAIAHRKAL